MKRYIGKRLLQMIPILFGITIVTFILISTSGTDAVDVLEQNTGTAWSDEEKTARREELGLDESLPAQYLKWLGGVLTGDMGTSYISGESVSSLFFSRVPATALLALVSILITVVLSVPLGIVTALHQGGIADRLVGYLCFAGNAMPNFFIALLLIYIFCVRLGVLPVISTGINVKSIILPAFTLAIAMTAKYLRQVRAAVLEELSRDYVTGARARGITENHILCRHVLRSAMVTIVTLLGMSAESLLGGTAIVETIFMWDGVGSLTADAALTKDYPVLGACVIWMSIVCVVINLFTDLLYGVLDPSIKGAEEAR